MRKIEICLLALIFGWLSLGVQAQSQWNWASPTPQGNWLADVACSTTRCIAVGFEGTLLFSEDNETWSLLDIGAGRTMLNGIAYGAYGDGGFVVVGDNGSIFISVDGATWQSIAPVTANHLRKIIYANNQYTVVGDNVVLTSAAGTNWLVSGVNANLRGVVYGDGKWVAVGYHYDEITRHNDPSILCSVNNGQSWSSCLALLPDLDLANGQGSLMDIAYANGRFVIVGNDIVLTRADADKAWSKGILPDGTSYIEGYSVSYGDGKFVATGYYNGMIVSSDGGVSWTDVGFMLADNYRLMVDTLYSITYVNGSFLTVGSDGAIYVSAGSNLTDTWHSATNVPVGVSINDVLWGACFAGDRFWVTDYSNEVLLNSLDGMQWSSLDLSGYLSAHSQNVQDAEYLLSIASDGDQKLAVGTAYNAVLVSNDKGANWTVARPATIPTSGFSTSIPSITYANGLFVAVLSNGHVLTSADNFVTPVATGVDTLVGVTYGAGRFVAVGYNALNQGVITISSSGVGAWTPVNVYGLNDELYAITYGNGRFVAVGKNGAIWTSPDGAGNWSQVGFGVTSSYLYGIAYADSLYIAVGQDFSSLSVSGYAGTALVSTDGITWATDTITVGGGGLHGIAVGNNRFITTGYSAAILYRDGDLVFKSGFDN